MQKAKYLPGWLLLTFMLLIVTIVSHRVEAADISYAPDGEIYENEEYDFSGISESKRTVYGKNRAGFLRITGAIDANSTFRGTNAYGVSGPVRIGYYYDKTLFSDEDKEWHFTSCSNKTITSNNGEIVDLDGSIKDGTIVVQKSSNKSNWVTVQLINDFYDEFIDAERVIYEIPENEYLAGTYYRVFIAYEVSRQIVDPFVFEWGAKYQRKKYLETYSFYVCYENNPVVIRDIVHHTDLPASWSVRTGFYIDKGGSTFLTTVSKDGGAATNVDNLASFNEKGEYSIDITSNLGKKYHYDITINPGLTMYELRPDVFESEDKKGYPEENNTNGHTVFGGSSYTSLYIGQSAENDITPGRVGSFRAYGIEGASVSVFLELNYDHTMNNSGWNLSNDEWGKYEKEFVNGIQTGMVSSGAVMVQVSVDGINWHDANKGRYADGLYTTDFGNNYGDGKKILIYTPKGEDVINGLYFRVYYAYEVQKTGSKEYKNYLEKYSFYLCNGSLEAVTFHNLSVNDKIDQLVDEDDHAQIELYKRSETMLTGAYTVSGFQIDTSLNPTVSVNVKKNGADIVQSSDNKYTDTGKYEISLTSKVGKKKTVILYVDRMSYDSSLLKYFGDSFISGKRIFSEGEYPVFEAGLTQYHIEQKDDNYALIQGTITNMTTGTTSDISQKYYTQNIPLHDAGEYVVTLTTNPNYKTGLKSGDAKTFVFHFILIEKGTAPGPVVNKNLLEEYSHKNISDSKPIYYGLTYHSATKGNITAAYDTWDEAFNAAYNYEKGLVEVLDGKTRYTGAFVLGQKVDYESNWDLTEATNFYAEKAIEKSCFDISDPSTYLTLRNETIEANPNLRQLELDYSVVIFADGQKEKMTDLDALPIINDKPYNYLEDGKNKVPEKGFACFEFIRDKYGCDSDKVVITDKDGREYDIAYNKSVGEQLKEKCCPSGIVTITETTIYGDSNSYEAVFIAEGDNTSSIEVQYTIDGKDYTKTVDCNNCDELINADYFSISSTKDELDPYGLIKVVYNNDIYKYSMHDGVLTDDGQIQKWNLAGDYEIICTNRLGYSYSVKVHVNPSNSLLISFSGEGTLQLENIVTSIGERNVELPALNRYGYTFLGYMDDETGEVYTSEINQISQAGTMKLRALWQINKVKISLQNADGSLIGEDEVEFGQEYSVPVYEAKEGEAFEGWLLDQALLTEKTIKIEKDEPLVLVASVVATKVEVSETETDTKETINDEEESHSAVGIVIALVVCALLIVATVIAFAWKKRLLFFKSKDDM